jgi:competence protein ComEC
MTVVLLINPLSALNIGFALSFGAVFVLVLLAESQQYTVLYAKKYQRVLHALKQLLWAQVVIFIGLLPFMLLYFSQVSLLAPAINFIAIPVMGFVILPTILLALVFWCISDNDYGLLVLAEYELQLLFEFIAATNQFFKAFFTTFPTLAFNQSMIMVLALASLLLLLPKVFKVWPLGILLLCMVFFSKPHTGLNNNKLLMRVFDVDQGLSIFIQTENHNVLIDTGSAWPKGSMVNSAIKPYLLLQGIKDMDKVIISHLDNDHSGGIYDVLDAFNVKEVISSEPIENINAHICKTGDQWQWDDVIFTVMHPDNVDNYWKRNNKSCVLLIKVAGRSILLPGDAEALVEREIGHELPNIDVMIAPHHGSKTSSTLSWVQKVKNGIVIFSSGYLSQFKHPHPLIEQRYKAVNAKAFTTALEGMITVEIAGDGHISTYGWRETEGKYWQKNHRINNHSD